MPSIWAIQVTKGKTTHRCKSSMKTEAVSSHLISLIIYAKKKEKTEYQRLLYHQLRIQHVAFSDNLSS